MTTPSSSTQPATASNPLDSTESMDPSQAPAGYSSTQPATASNPLDSTKSMDPSQVPAGLARAIEIIIQQTFHSYHRSAVLVVVRTTNGDFLGAGGGFIIGKKETSYLVMTCRHCIVSNYESEVTLSIRLAGRTTEYKAEKLYDHEVDLAIIKAEDIPGAEKCPVLQFGNLEDTPVLGANTSIVQLGYVLQSGSHLNLYPAVALGSITTPRHLAGSNGLMDIIYTAPAVHGTSGSAVLLNSKVIAMLYAGVGHGQTLYAWSVQAITMITRDWLQTPDGQAPSMEQMIQDMLTKI